MSAGSSSGSSLKAGSSDMALAASMPGCWHRGGRTLDQMQDAEVADLPKVCCRCAVFADFSCVQKWSWYVCAIEQLAKAYSKDKEALKEHLDTLKKNFEAAPACE